MTHLTPDELVDAVDGVLASPERDHLDGCAACQFEVTQLSAALREVRVVDVPEPSPSFWAHFSRRVRTAVEAEDRPEGGWPHWLGWRVIAPFGALALVVLALMVAVPWQTSVLPPQADLVSTSDLESVDDTWTLVADLVGDLDWDTARAAGLIVRPDVVDEVALELGADEGRELARLIRAELEP